MRFLDYLHFDIWVSDYYVIHAQGKLDPCNDVPTSS